jgi:hypothetical protein
MPVRPILHRFPLQCPEFAAMLVRSRLARLIVVVAQAHHNFYFNLQRLLSNATQYQFQACAFPSLCCPRFDVAWMSVARSRCLLICAAPAKAFAARIAGRFPISIRAVDLTNFSCRLIAQLWEAMPVISGEDFAGAITSDLQVRLRAV